MPRSLAPARRRDRLRRWWLQRDGHLPSVYPVRRKTRLIGVEAAGEGIATGKHSASLTPGRARRAARQPTYLLQDADGQIIETHSVSAGLDYPGVGPEHAYLKDSHRAEYVSITDDEGTEGIPRLLPASRASSRRSNRATRSRTPRRASRQRCERPDPAGQPLGSRRQDMHTVAQRSGLEWK